MEARKISLLHSVRATLRDWLRTPMTGQEGAQATLRARADAISGVTVTPRELLTVSAAWACARLISETISTLPLGVYERAAGGRRMAPHHPLHALIRSSPNPDSSAAVFWEAVVAAMLLRGNAYIEKGLIGDRLSSLAFLDPDRLSIERDGSGAVAYRYRDESGHERKIPAARIWNIPGFSLDGRCGLSVIRYGVEVFGSALAADRAAAGSFQSGLLPRTWFRYPKLLKPEQRSEAREAIATLNERIHNRKPVILEAEMEAGTIGVDPVDAQLLESRRYSVEEICRWFRVPPFMVGHSEKSTSWGTGIEQQMIGFLTFTLGPWLKRIEQAIVKDLLSPVERARYYPKFAVEGLLRSDSAGRSAFYGAMVTHGVMTIDEVRELEDMPAMGGNAGKLMVQSAMTTLDSI